VPVRHDGSLEERFVMVEQIDEIDIAIEVRVLLAELHHHASQLQLPRSLLRRVRVDKAECLLFGLGEGGRLVERWIVEHFDSVLVVFVMLITFLPLFVR